MYKDQVTASKGDIWAVLAKHNVPPHRAIKTISDVESFQVMFRDYNGKIQTTGVIKAGPRGEVWKNFICNWFNDRAKAVAQANREAGNLA
jgi:hypothetical protein